MTYAGYRGAYGKVVELDHGNGIATLYGHLHRNTVSVGQRVEAQTEIGLLGSTGRASGPHVHYEVIVNGQPQDPEKSIRLAHLVRLRRSDARERSLLPLAAQRAKSLASEKADLCPT